MHQKTPKNTATGPQKQLEITVFTSLLLAAVRRYVSRKPSNSRGRKGKAQNPRGIQASDRREVRNAILHHQPGWKGCSSLSLRGMAEDRGEAGAALQLQPDQEEVFESHQLLRPGSGDGRAGKTAGPVAAAGVGGHQGRGGRGRQPYLSGSAEHRAVPQGHR